MSTETKRALEDAQKIWSPGLAWSILAVAGLQDAAADFILKFSSQISSRPPTVSEMLGIAHKWNKLNPLQRAQKVEEAKVTTQMKVEDVATRWEPLELVGLTEADVKDLEKVVTKFSPIEVTSPVISSTQFGAPIVPDISQSSIDLDPLIQPAETVLNVESKEETAHPIDGVVDASEETVSTGAPPIKHYEYGDPEAEEVFTLRIPTGEESQKMQFAEMSFAYEVDQFTKEIDQLLADPSFDPRLPIKDSAINYVQKAVSLKDVIVDSFGKLPNKGTRLLAEIYKTINKLVDRLDEISEREYPTYKGKHEYVSARAKIGVEVKVEEKQRLDEPDIEIIELGPLLLFGCAAKESVALYGGSSGHGQDALGARQIYGSDGKVTGHYLLQMDGVGQSFRAEFFAKILAKILLRTPLMAERLLYTSAAEYQECLSMEGTDGSPEILIDALESIRDQYGSHSTVNQVIVTTEGRVAGSFRGDGIMVVIRKNGDTESYPLGSSGGALMTKKPPESRVAPFAEYQRKDLSIEQVSDGKGVVLDEGDCLILSSDGTEHGTGKLEQIVEIVKNGTIGEELKAAIAEILWQPEKHEDDKGVIIYRHQAQFNV